MVVPEIQDHPKVFFCIVVKYHAESTGVEHGDMMDEQMAQVASSFTWFHDKKHKLGSDWVEYGKDKQHQAGDRV